MNYNLPAVRLSQYAVEAVSTHAAVIRPLARITSPTLTTACRQAGLPLELAELCGAVLASVVDDLVMISRLPRSDFERTRRRERIIAATSEPACYAFKLAAAASPINGRAAVAHWDTICEHHERGKLAWLLGMDTELGYKYGKRILKNNEKSS